MKTNLTLAACFAASLVCNGMVVAGEKEDALVNKVVAAYGGDKFKQIKTIKMTDEFHSFRGSQSYRYGEVDLERNITNVAIDFENQRKSYRWLIGENLDELYSQHQMFDGKTGYRIQHNDKSFSTNPAIDFARADRRQSYALDTFLAQLLLQSRESLTLLEPQTLYSGMHQVVKFKAKGYPEMTLYVDDESGRISMLEQPDWLPNSKVKHHFSNYQKQQGILYAASYYNTRGGKPQRASYGREIEFNTDLTAYFSVPEGYSETGASLDFSEMSVKKLADNVYLVGQHWGFSIFVDAGDYYIGAGGYNDLTQRFAAVQQHTKTNKPLKYQVVSHHHTDHLGGMKEAAELGVTFVAVSEHFDAVREQAEQALPASRFKAVDGSLSLANGLVTIVDVPNGHANHNLVTYFAPAKTVFTADMYVSRAVSGVPNGYDALEKFKDKLDKAGLEVKHFAAAHSGRVLSLAEFKQSLTQRSETVCPTGWAICQVVK